MREKGFVTVDRVIKAVCCSIFLFVAIYLAVHETTTFDYYGSSLFEADNQFCITSQPQNYEGAEGSKAGFVVVAQGEGLTYQWQYSSDGGKTWKNSSVVKNKYTTTLTKAANGRKVRCIVTNAGGESITSDEALMKIEEEEQQVAIVTQPQDYSGEEGSKASFIVVAQGEGLTYQWQYSSNDGKTWKNSSVVKNKYTTSLTKTTDGRKIRCIVKDKFENSVTSNEVVMKIVNNLEITENPQSFKGKVGEKAVFAVEATGTGLTYQWQYSNDDGNTWKNSSVVKKSYTTTVAKSSNGRRVRCIVTDSLGRSVTSEEAVINVVAELKILTNPSDCYVVNGSLAMFAVEVQGEEVSYQWQYSDDEGKNWVDANVNDEEYSFDVDDTMVNRRVRCLATDVYDGFIYSDEASVLFVDAPKIQENPHGIIGTQGEMAVFEVVVTGKGLSYLWQYSDDGANWVDAEETQVNKYEILLEKNIKGRKFRCIVTDMFGRSVTSGVAVLEVEDSLEVLEQPQNLEGKEGSVAEFYVEVKGEKVTYKWQVKYSGTDEWVDTDEVTDTYSFVISANMDNMQVRCVVADKNQVSIVTDEAVLSVEACELGFKKQPDDWSAAIGTTYYFEALANKKNVSYTWQFSSNEGKTWVTSKVTSNVYSSTMTLQKDGQLIRCIVKDEEENEVISREARLRVESEFGIINQPVTVSGEFGDDISFYVQAGGENLSYNWQISVDSEQWGEISGISSVNSPRLRIKVRPSYVGMYFKCIISDNNGEQIESESVRLLHARGGRVKYDGRIYYIDSDGYIANGFKKIDDNYYYFINGATAKEFVTINDEKYYFDPVTGMAKEGLHYIGSVVNESNKSALHYTYYTDNMGRIKTGWVKDGDKTYYFYDNGVMVRGLTDIEENAYYFDFESGQQQTGLISVGHDAWMYFDEDNGGAAVTGLRKVGENSYYFSEEEASKGVALSGMLTIDNTLYYFDEKTFVAKEGFVTVNGRTYYTDGDGICLSGIITVEGKKYYLDDKCVLRTGLSCIDGKYYYFFDDDKNEIIYDFDDDKEYTYGEALTGWCEIISSKLIYYFDPDTAEGVKGVNVIDEKTYYFNERARLRTGMFYEEDVLMYYQQDNLDYTGWIDYAGRKYYSDGEHKILKGLNSIDGQKYYFSTSNGSMLTGNIEIDGARYYFDPYMITGFRRLGNGYTYHYTENGADTGLLWIDDKMYCFSDKGTMMFGRQRVGEDLYYFDDITGSASSGWITIKSTSGYEKSYFDEQTFKAYKGFKRIDGDLYYFDGYGFMATGECKIGDKKYFFDKVTGKIYTGFINKGESVYYYDGENGMMTGLAISSINGKNYCLAGSGAFVTGLITINDKRYYFNPASGEIYTGFIRINDNILYSDGLNGIVNGLRVINGKQYYFSPSGLMQFGFKVIDGERYYFDGLSGVRTYGIFSAVGSNKDYMLLEDKNSGGVVEYGGVKYQISSSETLIKGYSSALGMYFDSVTGEAQYGLINFLNSSGEEKTFYFGKDGVVKSVKVIVEELDALKDTDGWKEYLGEKYYVHEGEFVKGMCSIEDEDGTSNTYYFSNLSGVMLTGMRRIDGVWYWFGNDGKMQVGQQQIDGKAYYFDVQSGAGFTGLTENSNGTVYYVEGGGMFSDGDLFVNDVRYGFSKDGYGTVVEAEEEDLPSQNENAWTWITEDEKRYYCDCDGNRLVGEYIVDGQIYLFDENGVFEGENNDRYYSDGEVLKGFQVINGNAYYYNPVSGRKSYGEVKIDGNWYYFDVTTGVMQTGWIDGVYYDEDGENVGVLHSGWLQWNDNLYWLGNDGRPCTGMCSIADNQGNTNKYLFDENGVMQTGLIFVGDNLYYFSEEADTLGIMQTGFVTDGDDVYYFDLNKGYAVKGMNYIDNHYYYFDNSYKLHYGLQEINGLKYYFVEEGDGLLYGLVSVTETDDVTGEEITQTYYCNESTGAMRTGYWVIDGVKYYFSPQTGASVEGVYYRGNGIYYGFKKGGGVLAGLVKLEGKDYYFYPSTGRAALGLVSMKTLVDEQEVSNLYYFSLEEGMLKNTKINVAGINYVIDENGIVTVDDEQESEYSDWSKTALIKAAINKLGSDYYDRIISLEEASGDDATAYSCSTFVQYLFGKCTDGNGNRIDIPNVVPVQYFGITHDGYDYTVVESLEEAMPGDIIYLSMPLCRYGQDCRFWSEMHHVMVYLGDGKVMEATSGDGGERKGVLIQDFACGPEQFIYQIVRINGMGTVR